MALNGNYVSMDFIIERLFKNSIIARKANLSEYDLAEYIGNALLLIGAKPQFQDNFAVIDIKEYKGVLPCKPTSIEAIRSLETGTGANTSTDTFAGSPNNSKVTRGNQPIRLLSDEYEIKGNIIHVDTMKEGQMEIKFQSLKTDDRGFPMIPDDERYAEAIESYIKYKIYLPQWEIGEIRDAVFTRAESEWLWYVASASSKATLPSQDQMEAIKNSMLKLVRDFNIKTDNGRSIGIQEQRRSHNSI